MAEASDEISDHIDSCNVRIYCMSESTDHEYHSNNDNFNILVLYTIPDSQLCLE